MGQLLVRGLDQAIIDELWQRAVAEGRSAEVEHRRILEGALAQPAGGSFAEVPRSMPDVGADEDFARRQDDGGEHRVPATD